MCFSMKRGLIAGRHHIVYSMNCQDSLCAKTFKRHKDTCHIGVVADGCGEGTRSEVGAHMATSFLIQRMEELLMEGKAAEEIPTKLFHDLLRFLHGQMAGLALMYNSYQAAVQFIKDHMLFTVLGFIITPKTTVIFALGDGVIVLNDMIDVRDENNHPFYISYHLVDKSYLVNKGAPLPLKFDTYIFPTEYLERLAVGTDAWADEMGVLLSLWDEKLCKSVQRTMNLLSKKEKRFKDDAAIITAARQKEVADESESG